MSAAAAVLGTPVLLTGWASRFRGPLWGSESRRGYVPAPPWSGSAGIDGGGGGMPMI
jgi:hypothetical protein